MHTCTRTTTSNIMHAKTVHMRRGRGEVCKHIDCITIFLHFIIPPFVMRLSALSGDARRREADAKMAASHPHTHTAHVRTYKPHAAFTHTHAGTRIRILPVSGVLGLFLSSYAVCGEGKGRGRTSVAHEAAYKFQAKAAIHQSEQRKLYKGYFSPLNGQLHVFLR